jgi:hypothetical protein
MAQRSTRSKSGGERRQKEAELARVEAEQLVLSALDDPAHPDQASPIRGWAYFAVVVALSLVLNLLVLIAITGGR